LEVPESFALARELVFGSLSAIAGAVNLRGRRTCRANEASKRRLTKFLHAAHAGFDCNLVVTDKWSIEALGICAR
jgi:hypothetical protein